MLDVDPCKIVGDDQSRTPESTHFSSASSFQPPNKSMKEKTLTQLCEIIDAKNEVMKRRILASTSECDQEDLDTMVKLKGKVK